MRLSARLWTHRHTDRGISFVNAVLDAAGHRPIGNGEHQRLRGELHDDAALRQAFEAVLPRLREIAPHKRFDWATRTNGAGADIFYVLPRLLRPSLVVETGVAAGSMSSFIITALQHNRHGTLHSFDLPPMKGERSMDWTAKDGEVGFLIPTQYRDRWDLTIGDATYELPRKYQGRDIDLFFHDSDHTFAHMTYEYAFAAKHLRKGGIVISDDIGWNGAFRQFYSASPSQCFIHAGNPNIGVAIPAD